MEEEGEIKGSCGNVSVQCALVVRNTYESVSARPSATIRRCSLSSRKCIRFERVDWIMMGPDVGSVSRHLNEKSLIVNRIARIKLTIR
jgi:hypothetical protein